MDIKIDEIKKKLLTFGERVYKTIIRHGFDQSGLTKSKIIFSNLFLHIHPVKVHRRSLMFKSTLGLGVIAFVLFFILIVSGLLIMFHYVPSTIVGPDGFPDAYQRMLNLRSNVFWGTFIRNMHRWGAHAMCAIVALHMLRTFLTGSYRNGREFNWVLGCILGLLTILLSYTGYLLPWDQLAYWGVKVGTEIAKIAPGGDIIRGLLLGDNEVGQEALLRFYVLHVAILPFVISIVIALHFFRIRKDGGLARPADTKHEKLIPHSEFGTVKNNSVFKSARSYKLVELVKDNAPKVNEEVDQMVFAWPKLITRELILFMLVLAVMVIVSVLFNAALEAPADPNHPTNPSKAPWYFLGLQELVSYHGFIGGVAIPGILVGLVTAAPYIEMFIETMFNIQRKIVGGVWFHRQRILENSLFLTIFISMLILIIIGTFFRGPNWAFIYPWDVPVSGGH
ncbi:MAG: hypothetical protein A2X86_00335 [Bdellovibrionales bacterium GWA2_49_15]|nr:MAG: hypothetical protein A2X86_00335 [Bdellovibrionales bacterium GWA2_49_15]HAZ14490.1 cytochrome B6 [Bdellovibrionales bacterium]